ncbi:type IX secretion system sortase PorU [Cryomorphaceae bacterium 1068]|nr:type IX secretion system sortase PorU [Cryomorphaceae bacterium 1068]
MSKNYFLLTLFIVSSIYLSAQQTQVVELNWQTVPATFESDEGPVVVPTFDGALHILSYGYTPRALVKIPLNKGQRVTSVSVNPLATKQNFKFDRNLVSNTDREDNLIWVVKDERGIPQLMVEYLPFSQADGAPIEKFEIRYVTAQDFGRPKTNDYADNSVMATGDWYKIGVVEDGVYKLTLGELEALGIETDVLNPQALNIFGNGYGQLPYDNSVERPDDLLQNAIYIEGEADELFDEEDYILFYAKGPHKWNYDSESGLFDHEKHEYSDTSYYFIGINTGLPPKRIQNLSSSGSSPTVEINSFNDYAFQEVDRENVLKSGRTWYGEKFDVQTVYTYSGERFTFPNHIADSPVTLRASVISRNTAGSSTFQIGVNGETQTTSISSVGTGVVSAFARTRDLTLITSTPSSALNISFAYDKRGIPSASGWLDWFNVNIRRELTMARSQMIFRDVESVGQGQIGRFNVANANSIQEIWEVTSPADIKRIQYNNTGGVATFTLTTETIREFVAFTGSSFKEPAIFGPVGNQNLHALGAQGGIDMVIVSPSFLVSQAEQLAEIHRNHPEDPLSVEVVALNRVYNEFSSGMRDVTAIKWLMKMLYDRTGGNDDLAPKYLLLFGDGSYDNINFSANNSNLIPTYQSENSLSPTSSFVSDDYYGLLSDDDGDGNADLMDISVGRLVIKNSAEASSVVNKISRYIETSSSDCLTCNDANSSFGSWRNIIALVADDEDLNNHMQNSRTISSQIEGYTKVFNLERIFTDAFQQVATPGGDRYPDVNEAIDRRVRNGAFIINYIGHGGETGWAQERILDIPTILDWDNTYQMPIFMTATCEFTRFDDPIRTSAGEYVLLNAGGGGVALLTTTRLVYAGPNFQLNTAFYDALFTRPEDEVVTRLGDVYRDTKNISASSSPNHRNFSLIGDPALPMAIPKYDIFAASITDTLGNPVDTLKALGVARVAGTVTTASGQVNSNFNGLIEATVYDRVKQRNTLSNDGGSVFTYPTQEDVVYKGLAEVNNGQFEFDFVLPKDISFAVDTTARISFYAYSQTEDATGFEDGLSIGDRDENAVNDGQGPEIDLFMNDENFVFGGYTDNEPILLAKIFDPNGVNTVGTGIGHDISAVLDGDVANTFILNDYYSSDLSTYQRGSVKFPFDELSPGNHSVELTVWDVHNNSSKSNIEFIVAESEGLAIERVLNYPNPFTTHTEFYFEHNQSTEFLNVLIEIYTVTGKLVKTINTVSNTEGFRNVPIPWDGRDDFGDRLATGTYVYKVSVKNPSGDKDMKFEKLVILN